MAETKRKSKRTLQSKGTLENKICEWCANNPATHCIENQRLCCACVELAARYSGFANATAIESAIQLSKENSVPFSQAVEAIVKERQNAINEQAEKLLKKTPEIRIVNPLDRVVFPDK